MYEFIVLLNRPKNDPPSLKTLEDIKNRMNTLVSFRDRPLELGNILKYQQKNYQGVANKLLLKRDRDIKDLTVPNNVWMTFLNY